METFSFVGKLSALTKEKDNFKFFEKKEFDSGWVAQTCNCFINTNGQSHLLKVSGGYSKKDPKCYVQVKEDGKYKREPISFKDRKNEDVLERAESWSLFKLEVDGHKMAFISGYDFAKKVADMINSGKYKETVFKVFGNVNRTPSKDGSKFYETYEVKQIVATKDDETQVARSKVDLFVDKDSLPEIDKEEGTITVDAFVQYWDSESKENKYCPYVLTVEKGTDDKAAIRYEVIQKRYFDVKDEKVYKIRAIVDVFNGNEKVEISYDDLDDETKESVDLGIITLEDAAKELSEDGNMYGDRITKNIFVKPATGFSKGFQETDVKVSELRNTGDDNLSDDDFDSLFSNDDDDVDFIDDDELPF